MTLFKTLVVGALCVSVSGCVVSRRTVDPTPTAGASTAVTPNAAQDQDLLTQVNAFRSSQGQSALAFSPVLQRAAQGHSNDMAQSGSFSHTGSDGSSISDRVRRVGYGFCVVAENIALGQKSLSEAMDSWENSPGHRANLLNPGITEVGLGRTGDYWTMVFGAPGC